MNKSHPGIKAFYNFIDAFNEASEQLASGNVN